MNLLKLFGIKQEEKFITIPSALDTQTSWQILTRSPNLRSQSPEALASMYAGIAYACINKIAQSAAMVPIGVYTTKNISAYGSKTIIKSTLGINAPENDIKELPNHPLTELLKNPNDYMTTYDLLEGTYLNLEIFGNAYWYIEYDAYNKPNSIELLCSQYVEPIVVDGKIANYKYGGTITLDINSIVHIKYPNPGSILIGKSPLGAAFADLTLLASAREYDQGLFDNMAMPGLIITSKSKLTKETKEQFRADWNNMYKGTNKAGKVGILDGEVEITPLGYPQKDTSLPTTRNYAVEQIAATLGVPITMIKLNSSNRASAEAGLFDFAQYTLSPKLVRISQQLTKELAVKYDPNLFIAFDNPVGIDKEYKLKEIDILLKYGAITNDEAKQILGY